MSKPQGFVCEISWLLRIRRIVGGLLSLDGILLLLLFCGTLGLEQFRPLQFSLFPDMIFRLHLRGGALCGAVNHKGFPGPLHDTQAKQKFAVLRALRQKQIFVSALVYPSNSGMQSLFALRAEEGGDSRKGIDQLFVGNALFTDLLQWRSNPRMPAINGLTSSLYWAKPCSKSSFPAISPVYRASLRAS